MTISMDRHDVSEAITAEIKISKKKKSRTNAQNILLKQSNESGIYKSGENIRVTAFSEGLTSDSVSVKILKNYNEIQNQKIKWTGDSLVIFNENIG